MPKNFRGTLVGNQWDDVVDPSIALDRYVGIELEVEKAPGWLLQDPEAKVRTPIQGADQWAVIKDGSLRNFGAEFVSFPMPISKVALAVKQLFKLKDLHSQDWCSSVRTSLHAHVNVRDFGIRKLQNLLVAFPLVEPALFNYVGKEREECIYCVPWYRAPNDAKTAANALSTSDDKNFSKLLRRMTRSLSKYSSLYLAPITRIGTVEFRMAPTWLDPKKIIEWVTICERIVSYAANCSTYYNVLDDYDTDPQTFVSKVTAGYLKAPVDYELIVSKLGADLLARQLFPESLEEWVRLSDGFLPKTGTSHTNPSFFTIKPPQYIKPPHQTKPKIGDVKKTHSGIPYVYNGTSWQEDPWSIPDGTVVYAGAGLYKKWDVPSLKWIPFKPTHPLVDGVDLVSQSFAYPPDLTVDLETEES